MNLKTGLALKALRWFYAGVSLLPRRAGLAVVVLVLWALGGPPVVNDVEDPSDYGGKDDV